MEGRAGGFRAGGASRGAARSPRAGAQRPDTAPWCAQPGWALLHGAEHRVGGGCGLSAGPLPGCLPLGDLLEQPAVGKEAPEGCAGCRMGMAAVTSSFGGGRQGYLLALGTFMGALLGESALVKQVTLELLLSAYLF